MRIQAGPATADAGITVNHLDAAAVMLAIPHAEQSLCEVAHEDLRFMIDTFLVDAPLQLRTMAGAVAEGDLPLLARTARSLRSSSERLGVAEMAKIASKMSATAGYSGCAGSARSLLARLETAFLDSVPVLLDRLGNHVAEQG